jgi:hypothetical protein
MFPFGYSIIYFGQNQIMSYQIITNGLLGWKIDVSQVRIALDYFNGKVNWTIPNVSSEPSGAGLHLTVGELDMVSDFKKP